MSWLGGLFGKEPEPYREDPDTLKVPDPSIPNRMVSNKQANRPFLAHKEYRDRQEALHKAWLERKKIRDEKIAKGEPVGPEEKDPTAQEEIGLLDILKFLFCLVIIVAFAGKFVTGSYTWDYESKWMRLRTYWPESNSRLFSETGLTQFDGSVPGRPIYLAIDGDVFDVTAGKAYQPGGSYAHFAGVDAARAFATGCFKEHRTHDLRGLNERELQSIEHWKKFYADHKDYFKVGRVSHPPIDPASPIPKSCKAEKKADGGEQSQQRPVNQPRGGAGGEL